MCGATNIQSNQALAIRQRLPLLRIMKGVRFWVECLDLWKPTVWWWRECALNQTARLCNNVRFLQDFIAWPKRPDQIVLFRSRQVPMATTLAISHNTTKPQDSCPQRSSEELELSQGWLEALLPSHRWFHWEIATSVRIKYWEGIPGFLWEPTICG